MFVYTEFNYLNKRIRYLFWKMWNILFSSKCQNKRLWFVLALLLWKTFKYFCVWIGIFLSFFGLRPKIMWIKHSGHLDFFWFIYLVCPSHYLMEVLKDSNFSCIFYIFPCCWGHILTTIISPPQSLREVYIFPHISAAELMNFGYSLFK